MTQSASHGAASRRPMIHNGRSVEGVYVRELANGTRRYEFQSKRNGKTSRRTLAASTPTDAVNEASRLRVVAEEVGLGDGSLRLATLADRFFAEARSSKYEPPRGRLAASTLALYQQRIESHVLPALGHSARVRNVKVEHLRLLIDRMRFDGLSGSTIQGTVAATAALFRYAVHRGHVPVNPVLSLDGDLPSASRQTEPIYLSREQADALLEALGDEFRPVAAVCLFAGLRVSEALGLQWADIDLTEETLAVRRQLGRDGASLVPLKTRSSAATLVLPAPLVAELRAHRDRQLARGFDRVADDRLVFVTRTGRSPGRRNVLRALQTQAEHLSLGNLGVHDLRHSTAGLLREAGLSDEEIAVVMRHSNARTTTAMYGGRSEDARQAIRAKAAEALA
jgi:integrase